MSGHLSLRPHDHGQIDFGCRGYGSLAYRFPPSTSHDDSFEAAKAGTSTSWSTHHMGTVPTPRAEQMEDSRFISEHNLAWYWRRPGLFPRTQGFPIPLAETALAGEGVRCRTPGMLRFDLERAELRNRNLLAGQLSKASEKRLSLWAVNDLSSRRSLIHYRLRLRSNKDRVKLLQVGLATTPDDEEEEGNDDSDCSAGEDAGYTNTGAALQLSRIPLPAAALQLRSYSQPSTATPSPEEGEAVLVRTEESLLLAKLGFPPTLSTLSPTPVHSFTQIPHIDGDMAVADSKGCLIRWGSIDSASTPMPYSVRLHSAVEAVLPTDCPRILVALAGNELVEVDLRLADTSGQSTTQCRAIYSLDADRMRRPTNACMPDSVYAYHAQRERLCHCSTVGEVGAETMLLTTTRRHLVLDRRMPNAVLLSMGHSEMNGGDYCLVTPSFLDPLSGARVHSLYSLTHAQRPSLSHWAFAFHPREWQWCSVGAKYELDSPGASIPRFAECHATIANSSWLPTAGSCAGAGSRLLASAQLPKYTRAIHYQPLHEGSTLRNSAALLFRQMDGGEIWYECVRFDPHFHIPTDDDQNGTPARMDQSSGEGLEPDNQRSIKSESLSLIDCYLRKKHWDSEEHRPGALVAAYYAEVDEELLGNPKRLLEPVEIRVAGRSSAIELDKASILPQEWTDPFASVGQLDSVGGGKMRLAATHPDEDSMKVSLEAAEAGGRLLSATVMRMHAKTLSYFTHRHKPHRTGMASAEPGSVSDSQESMA